MQLGAVRKQWQEKFKSNPLTIMQIERTGQQPMVGYIESISDTVIVLHPALLASLTGQADQSAVLYKPMAESLLFIDGAEIQTLRMELANDPVTLAGAGYKPIQQGQPSQAAPPPAPVVNDAGPAPKMPRVVMLPDDAPLPEGATVLQGEVIG